MTTLRISMQKIIARMKSREIEGRWYFVIMIADGHIIKKYRRVFAALAAHVALVYSSDPSYS
jgi:hypothetical protein